MRERAKKGLLTNAEKALLAEEEEMEIADWNAACEALAEMLDLPENAPRRAFPKSSSSRPAGLDSTNETSTKRKAPDADNGDVDMADGDAEKRAKVDEAQPAAQQDPQIAARISSFFGVLDQASIQAPKQPTKQEMEQILLEVRKKALLEEYGV